MSQPAVKLLPELEAKVNSYPDKDSKYRVLVKEPVAPVEPVKPKTEGLGGSFNTVSGSLNAYHIDKRAYDEALPKYDRDMAAHERFLDFEEALAGQYYEHGLQEDYDAMSQETKDKLAVAYSATSAISEVAQDAIANLHQWRDEMLTKINRPATPHLVMGGIDGLL